MNSFLFFNFSFSFTLNFMEKEPEEDKIPEKEISEDRPLECTECKKPIAVRYTEVIGDVITHTIMCADCPQLQRRLHGIAPGEGSEVGKAGLCCGSCGTTLDSIRMGNPVGCAECYTVFEDVILSELLATHRIPPRITPTKRAAPIHIGRAPGEMKELNPALKLLALNEALTETLRREDYEQAAWLRDQIKALETEGKIANKKEKKGNGQK
jgi:protein arginine kinase activator